MRCCEDRISEGSVQKVDHDVRQRVERNAQTSPKCPDHKTLDSEQQVLSSEIGREMIGVWRGDADREIIQWQNVYASRTTAGQTYGPNTSTSRG